MRVFADEFAANTIAAPPHSGTKALAIVSDDDQSALAKLNAFSARLEELRDLAVGIARELGEGIKRIFNEMRTLGLTDPIYTQTSGSVRLVLSSADALPEDIRTSLPKAARKVLDTLRLEGRPLSTGQIAELAGITRPTAIRHLQTLSNSAFWNDLNRDLEDPAFRDDFVAASEEIAQADAANSVSPEELRRRRNQFIAESAAEFGDIDASEVADLLDEARRNA